MPIVGTAGHVDHGKSTLVHALTGIDPDRFAEEKRRGLTIDLGFAWCTLPSGVEVGIVDVPGHERFIRNMLAGVGAIDVVLFVVAADEGWMPQSEEHLQIVEFLGVRRGVVALTKADLLDAGDLEAARDIVWQRLRGTMLHDAAIVAVSASARTGMDELRAALDDALASCTEHTSDRGRPRMFVDRSFTIGGAGTVVTGTLVGGRLKTGETIEIAPHGVRARIRSLQTHKSAVEEATPGSRVAANLVGLERTEIGRGDALVRLGEWTHTRSLAVRLVAASDMNHALTERGAYELYLGTAEVGCRVKFLEDGDGIVPVERSSILVAGLRPGASVLAQLFLDTAVVAGVGDKFVVRDVGRSRTVAGGVVLDQDAPPIRRGDPVHIHRLREREDLTPDELADQIVRERKIVANDLLRRLSGAAVPTTGYAIDASHARELEARAAELIDRHHRDHPLDRGMPREELRQELGVQAGAFEVLLTAWTTFAVDGNTVRAANRASALDGSQRRAADDALERLRAGGPSPPGLREAGLAVDLAKALERAGELVFVAPDIAYPDDVWREIQRKVIDAIHDKGPATVSDLRSTIGTSRKYAVPLLEKLDAIGITRRRGDVRELGPRGRELVSSD